MDNIKLSVVTPDGQVFDGLISSITLPGVDGEFGVYFGHCDIFALLKEGVIEILHTNGDRELVAINWGYANVSSSEIDVLVDSAVIIDGSSESALSKALDDAKELLMSANSNELILSGLVSKMQSRAKSGI